MRIIAGRLKGRRLESPPGNDVRPTSDRLRETLFNVLGPGIAGARVLDAFAGTGAVGLEALSRGAAQTTFVEQQPAMRALIARNAAACGVTEACAIIRGDFSAVPANGAFDVVWLDPPYAYAPMAAALERAAGLLAPGGRVILEHSRRRDVPEAVDGLQRVRLLVAGDSALSFFAAPRAAAEAP